MNANCNVGQKQRADRIFTDKQNDVTKYTYICCFLQNPDYGNKDNKS